MLRGKHIRWLVFLATVSVVRRCADGEQAESMRGCPLGSCVHGICSPLGNGSYECFCENGYTGHECQTDFDDCVSSPCHRGATCVDRVAHAVCVCPEGFTGVLCESVMNHCASQPCWNGGHCKDVDGGYVCSCRVGFSGNNCEIDVDVCDTNVEQGVQCSNGGTCVEGIGISFTCSCPSGFEGITCEMDINECISNPCLNNGTCVDELNGFTCICLYRWKGVLCEEEQPICSSKLCSDHGLCLGNDTDHTCYCIPDYHGAECQWKYNECLPEPQCLHSGTCEDGVDNYTCLCPPGFVGRRCETRCDARSCGESRCTSDTLYSRDTATIQSHLVHSEVLSHSVYHISPSPNRTEDCESSALCDSVLQSSNEHQAVSATSTRDYLEDLSSGLSFSSSAFFNSDPYEDSSSATDSTLQTNVSLINNRSEDLADSSGDVLNSFLLSLISVSSGFPESSWTVGRFSSPVAVELQSGINSFHYEPSTDTVPLFSFMSSEDGVDVTSKFQSESSTFTSDYFSYVDPSLETIEALTSSFYGLYFSTAIPLPFLTVLESFQEISLTVTVISTPLVSVSHSSLPSDLFNESSSEYYTYSDQLNVITDEFEVESSKISRLFFRSFFMPTSIFTVIDDQFIYSPSSVFEPTVILDDNVSTFSSETNDIIETTSYDLHFTNSIFPLQTSTNYSSKNHISTPSYPSAMTIEDSITLDEMVTTQMLESSQEHAPTSLFNTNSEDTVADVLSRLTTTEFSFIVTDILDSVREHLPNVTAAVGSLFTSLQSFDTTRFPRTYESDTELWVTTHSSDRHTTGFGDESGSGDAVQSPLNNWISPEYSHGYSSQLNSAVETLFPLFTNSFYTDSEWTGVFPEVTAVDSSSDNNDYSNSVYWPIASSITDSHADVITSLPLSPLQSLSVISSLSRVVSSLHPMMSSIISEIPVVVYSPETDTCFGVICHNGGTCHSYSMPEGSMVFTCLCPLHFTGIYCQDLQSNISVPSFSGFSWLVYKVFNVSTETGISIYLSFRTVTGTGVIFYLDLSSEFGCPESFILFEIQNGFPVLSFSCGAPSVISIEEGVRVDDGQLHTILVGIDWYENANRDNACNVSMLLDYWPSITAQQHGVRQFCPVAYLHVGRVFHLPHGTALTSGKHGFHGCMFELKINGLLFDFIDHALEGMSIQDCGHVMCTAVMCHHGGVCQVSSNFDLVCSCPAEFSGQFCERRTCSHSTCNNGGTCLLTGSSGDETGHVCLCPYGFKGLQCEQVGAISKLAFYGTYAGYPSFVAYPLNGSHSDFELFEIKLEFSVADMVLQHDRLLLFLGQSGMHLWNSTWFALGIQNSKIVLQYNVGLGTKQLIAGHWAETRNEYGNYIVHSLFFGFSYDHAWLKLDKNSNVSYPLHWPSHIHKFSLLSSVFKPLLYVGGYETYNFSFLPEDLIFKIGFSGCVYNVRARYGIHMQLNLLEEPVMGRNVQQCNTNPCLEKPCGNGGKCENVGVPYRCRCLEGWFGPMCDQKVLPCDRRAHKCPSWSTCVPNADGYMCNCPLGWTGSYCDKEVNFTDADFNGVNSFLSFAPQNIRYSLRIRMEFHSRSRDGILFYAAGHLGAQSSDFVCVSLNGGYVEFRYNLGRSAQATAMLRSKHRFSLDDEEFHVVECHQDGRHGFLTVDDHHVHGVAPSGMILMDTTTEFFLGGLPDMSIISTMAVETVPKYFNGCIRFFSVNDQVYDLSVQGASRGQNIESCNGTVCRHDVCQNGGTCVSIKKHHYQCVCPPMFTGSRCNIWLPCYLHLCQNGGSCVPYELDKTSSCDCALGWTGQYCEKAVKITSAYFEGNSHILVIDNSYPVSDRTRNKLSFVFSGTKGDGLILWMGEEHNNDDDYMGLGLERGQLKIVWNLGWFSRASLSTSQNYSLADSQWHSVDISRDGEKLTLVVDGVATYVIKSPGDYVELNTLGSYYLGGFPRSINISSRTNGHFHSGFHGCLQDFRLNFNTTPVDFMNADGGHNVMEC